MSLANLNDKQIEKIIQSFEELASYSNVEREPYDELVKKKKTYVPIIPDDTCIKALFHPKIDRKINFLVGKRGSGKTTTLKRAKIECLESFFIRKDLEYLKDEKMVLPVYIDIRTFFFNVLEKTSLDGDDAEDLNNLVKNMNIEFLRQIENTYDELRELGAINNSIFLKIENIIKNQIGKLEKAKPIFLEESDDLQDFYAKFKNSIQKVSFSDQNEKLILDIKNKKHFDAKFKNLVNLSVCKKLIDDLKLVKEMPLNYIHFLIDDFSEISIINQKFIIDGFIEPLFRSINDLCFCVACYPDLYYISSLKPIQDYQVIYLDWYNLYLKQTYEEKVRLGIELITRIVFKRLNIAAPETFREVKNLAIIFDEFNLFFKELFFLTMGNPILLGIILTRPKTIMTLQMKIKLSVDKIREASGFVFKEFLYKDYFKSLLKGEKSNYYFSELELKIDKLIFDNLIQFMEKKPIDKPNGFFIINEKTFQKEALILSRLELMGFIYRLEKFTENSILFCPYYGACAQNNIKFSLNENINYWKENIEEYDVTELVINVHNENLLDEKLFNQNELPTRFLKEKTDFESIILQLNEEQIKIIHTLYLYMEKNKGWMAPDEIGMKNRLFPFFFPHMRVIRMIRSIKEQNKAKFLIDETEKGKKLYRISNMGILFEEYCTWKLNL
ncbi:MAG: hypothetical protein ACFE8E_06340 [Candidatus Hodarchaeota archaeon]